VTFKFDVDGEMTDLTKDLSRKKKVAVKLRTI